MFDLQKSTQLIYLSIGAMLLCSHAIAAVPQATNDRVSGQINTPIVISVDQILSNDTDPDGDSLRVEFIDDWLNGSASFDSNAGTITFTPAEDFTGTGQFTYILSDGYSGPNYSRYGFGFVYIDITAEQSNEAPIAGSDTFTTDNDSPVNIYFSDLLANDSDPDLDDELRVVGVGPAERGDTEIDNTMQAVRYMADADFSGEDRFVYMLSDGKAQTEGNVSVEVRAADQVNQNPRGFNDRLEAQVNTALTFPTATILQNDVDPDGDALEVVLVDDWINGRAQLNSGNTSITFTPDTDFVGEAEFVYTMSDGRNQDNFGYARVFIDVSRGDQVSPPQANNDRYEISRNAILELNFSRLLANDIDPAGLPLTISGVTNSDGGNAQLDTDAQVVRFSPATDFRGAGGFDYTISNGSRSDSARVTVDVVGYFRVEVSDGSGDGWYREGSTITVTADTPPSGQQFDRWIGDNEALGDINAASTTLAITDSNISVHAKFSGDAADNQAPSQPQALSLVNASPNSATLRWNASSDNIGVSYYLVEIDGREIRADNNQITINQLQANTWYGARVLAADNADNRSEFSEAFYFQTETPSSTTDLSAYFFGHSLIYHTFTDYPRTSELAVPYWMNQLSQARGGNFQANGAFRTSTYALPADDGWGFNPNISAWEGNFANSDFDAAVYTEINYVQYQSPSTPYYGAGPNDTPINFALRLVDYAREQEPGIKFILYESWPDAGSFAPNYDPPNGQNTPPSAQRVADYYAYARGEYHDWWLELQDALNAARPGANIKMVPQSPILSKLLSSAGIGGLSQIPFAELYEDNAPHGRPSIYFLAGLIQYMGMYEERAPSNYTIPEVIHPEIRNNYSAIVDFIWNELQNFNYPDGSSRVW